MAKQRQVRTEQRGALAAMQQLEGRTDEQLESEQRNKAAALAILGARAAERYDSKTARTYFQRAIAAARPQERMQLRRMADASLALAERRPDDLKAAVERLGQAPPSGRQLFLLRLTGLIVPPPGSSLLRRLRGIAIVLGILLALLLIGFGLAQLIALPFGGVGIGGGIFYGVLIIAVILGVLAFVGRRRQKRAAAARASAAAR
jgi:hypothetical protein